MVILHVKKTDELQFLYETPVASMVDDTVKDLVAVWNLQIQIRRLCDSMEDLAKYGPAKRPDKQSIDTYQTDDYGNLINDQIPKGPYYCMDPTGRRTGEAPEPKLQEVINKQVNDAKETTNAKQHVSRNIKVNRKYFQDCLDCLRGAVTIAFPEGLPEYDDVRQILLGDWERDGRTVEMFEEGEAELWWAGKQMEQGQGKKLSDYLGGNDKTKIVAKLQRKGGGAPQREPAVDEKTQKEMMAFWHRKQEDLKKLAEDDEDAYMGAKWADPKQLKSHLQGTAALRWR